jgi:ABC-type antimicrobial peptide transport system permease subunit
LTREQAERIATGLLANTLIQRFEIKARASWNPAIGMGVIYVPIKTLNSMMGDEGYSAIVLTTSNVKYIDTIKAEAQQTLDQLLKVPPEQQITTGEENKGLYGILPAPFQSQTRAYQITTQEDVLGISDKITSMIQLALVAIAGISLLVGGIGIMNIMKKLVVLMVALFVSVLSPKLLPAQAKKNCQKEKDLRINPTD